MRSYSEVAANHPMEGPIFPPRKRAYEYYLCRRTALLGAANLAILKPQHWASRYFTLRANRAPDVNRASRTTNDGASGRDQNR